ncbi:MAG: MoxR family ATPase [Planctomycetota bacterium]|nr:MoxR family ATPase [Planctomycetota bacterium]
MPEKLDLPELELAIEDIESAKQACASFRDVFKRLQAEIGKVIVGQKPVVEQTLIALFANGHVLLEGVPGLGKTLLVSTLSKALTLPFARIQFTPDLMPADITGTSVVVEDPRTGHRVFQFRPGPIFHQLVLADEINRATPKSQSALLEAMQEHSVTVGGKTRHLGEPFFVMATQNPIEQDGTYALPEAQLDRFFFKVIVPSVSRQDMNTIVKRTTKNRVTTIEPIVDGAYILKAQKLARRIIVAPHVQDYVVRLILATHPGGEHSDPKINPFIHVGVSPRGGQALIAASKVKALMAGRYAVGYQDIIDIAPSALRHRIMRSFEAEADAFSTDDIVEHLLNFVPREKARQIA